MNFAIVVAAGSSTRMGKAENKVFLPLDGKPLIYHAINAFQSCKLIDGIIIVAQKNDFNKINEIKNQYKFSKIKTISEGGKERQDSVYNGLISIKNAKKDDIIIVHNGSNPLVSENEIVNCINDAKKYDAAACAFPLKDTIKKVKGYFVEKTVDRQDIWQMQTPQAIKYGLFIDAYQNARDKKIKATDDVSLVESLGKKVKIVLCSYENIKITTPSDMEISQGILMKKNNTGNFRIGFGQDSHEFSPDKKKKLVLGGYTIENEQGLKANSDGDVILHALFNSISTAIGERDLGHHSDPLHEKGITDSRKYLDVILGKMKLKKLRLNNVSIMIEAKKPKMGRFTDKIITSLSHILNLPKERIGIAYTSGEELTSFGKGLGIQCFVAVTLC